MKLTRASLKSLIKECIIEVLTSGIGDDSLFISESSTSRKPATPRRQKRSRSTNNSPTRTRKALDNITFDRTVNESVGNLTQDPVMQTIFADTAKTTLQDQYSHSNNTPTVPAGADRAAVAVASADPTQLFEGSSNWAQLAFMDTQALD
jgi:hypothetical protein